MSAWALPVGTVKGFPKAWLQVCVISLYAPCAGQAAPRDQMGAVNGMAMALASLSRALGPAVGGAAWAVTVSLPAQLASAAFLAMVRSTLPC